MSWKPDEREDQAKPVSGRYPSPAGRGFTIADYEALPEGAPFQLIAGELVMMTPAPTPRHQIVSRRLELALIRFVEQQGLGEVLDAPIDVVLSEKNVFQPDIIFIGKDRLGIIGEKNIEGAPDLVVEILSEGSAYHDLRTKKDVYARSLVREYWIVDPLASTIEVWENRDGKYVLVAECDRQGSAASSLLPGLVVEAGPLFA